MSAKLIRMSDASVPPEKLPKGTRAVAGYIGGNTPHVWTKKEWQQYGRIKKLPIWVYEDSDPLGQGFDILEQLFELNVPKGSPVVLDLETLVIPVAVTDIAEVVNWCGYKLWVYGSRDNLFSNPSCNGYWVADPTNVPHMYNGPKIRATQYEESHDGWDLSDVTDWAYLDQMKAW
jgi:hypothetical protein